jgi:hypothetical protein
MVRMAGFTVPPLRRPSRLFLAQVLAVVPAAQLLAVNPDLRER